MKDEQNCSYNGGGDVYLLKTCSDFSSLQYYYCKVEMDSNFYAYYSNMIGSLAKIARA